MAEKKPHWAYGYLNQEDREGLRRFGAFLMVLWGIIAGIFIVGPAAGWW